MIRFLYLCAYALLATLGAALVARPALLWLRAQGLLRAAPAWEVPLGAAALALLVLVALFTIWLALDAALRRKPRLPQHLAFLTVLGLCFAVRWAASEARPPPDPAPPLLAGLRGVAEELDRDFSGRYAPDAARLDAALAKLPPPGFRRLGRTLPLHVRVLSAEGPQLQPLAGDEPGTIYIAISSDAKSAWLTALALGRVLPQRIEAHSGTHSLPGRDPLVPAYPGMRSVAQPR